MNFSTWLTAVQGKLVPKDVLDRVKQHVSASISTSSDKRLVFNTIESFVNNNRIDVDVNYIFQNIMGYHIRYLSEDEENIITRERQNMSKFVDISMVPNMYVLRYIAQKNNIDIEISAEYGADRKARYDAILNQTSI
jgi:hypothetical protein